MSLILKMEVDLKSAWILVQAETDLGLRRKALQEYKRKLALYLHHKLFIGMLRD